MQIAPPERDLWILTTAFTRMIGVGPVGVDDEVMSHYSEAAGRIITPTGVAFYRLWWVLADIAAFTDDLRRPSGDGADAAAALTCLA